MYTWVEHSVAEGWGVGVGVEALAVVKVSRGAVTTCVSVCLLLIIATVDSQGI